MYSESFTKAAIAARAKKIGWKPVYHSIAVVERANAHFAPLIQLDDKGNFVGWTRPLTPQESEYIDNERGLCKQDFLYYATHYAFISDIRNKIVRFTPNLAQRIVLDVIAQMEVAFIAIILLFLKARQLGISTLAALLVLHRVIFTPGVKSVLGSSEPKRSLKLYRMFKLAWDRTPAWLRPGITKFSDGDFYEYTHGGFLDIAWGNKKTGICRGDTPTVGWLSELAEFEDVEEKVDASIVRAMHEDPGMLFICETTARGPGDWLQKTWDESVEGLEDGTNYYYPLFLPWYVGRDIYPTKARLRRQPVPSDWVAPKHIEDHASKAAEYVQDDPLLSKYLGRDWRMPIEQKWFYFIEHRRAKRKAQVNKGEDTLAKFLREMPANAEEAFTSQFGGIFDAEQIVELRNQTKKVKAVYAITGPEITFPVNEKERIAGPAMSITVHWSRDFPAAVYTFTPLRVTNNFNGKLVIYEFPEENEEHLVGVDTSHGKEKDSSVINIGRMWRPGRFYREQVAVFASNQISNSYLGPFCMAIGTFYSTLIDGQQKQCQFAIEIGMGDPVIDYMRDRGWWNFYQRVDIHAPRLSPKGRIGFSTDRYSRHNMMSEFSRAILEKLYRINHPTLLQDMSDLVWNHEKKRLEARPNGHDDHWMAAGIEYIAGEQFETVMGRTGLWQAREERQAKDEQYPEHDFGNFGTVDRDELLREIGDYLV